MSLILGLKQKIKLNTGKVRKRKNNIVVWVEKEKWRHRGRRSLSRLLPTLVPPCLRI